MSRFRAARDTECRSKTTFFSESPASMISVADTRPVNVVVDLPKELVADVEIMRQEDPQFLGRAIQYALARRIIFQELLGESPRVTDPSPSEASGR